MGVNKDVVVNKHDILMLFHTSLRNMGLFLSVTFAALVSYRFWKFKDKKFFDHIDKLFLIIAFLTTCVSLYIGYNVQQTINFNLKKLKYDNELYHILFTIYLIMLISIILLLYCLLLLIKY